MPMFTIDDVEYNTEDLSDNGKAQLASLQFLEMQMKSHLIEVFSAMFHHPHLKETNAILLVYKIDFLKKSSNHSKNDE